MSNIKVSLTIIERTSNSIKRDCTCEEIPYIIRKKDIYSKINKEEANKIIEKGTRKHYNIVFVPVKRHININKDAYDNFISDNVPERVKPFIWKTLRTKQRLEYHLSNICQHFNGISYNYIILED